MITIPGDTYPTWAQALAVLKQTFDAIPTYSQRQSCYIIENQVTRYSINQLNVGGFVNVLQGSDAIYSTSIRLSDCKLYMEIITSNSVTFTDYSSTSQGPSLSLFAVY